MAKRPAGLSKASAAKRQKVVDPTAPSDNASAVPEGYATVAVPSASTSNPGPSGGEGSDEDALTMEDLVSLRDQATELIEQLYVVPRTPPHLQGPFENLDIPAVEDKLAGLLRGVCHEAHRRMTLEAQADSTDSSAPLSAEAGTIRSLLGWATWQLGYLIADPLIPASEDQSILEHRASLRKEGEPSGFSDWLCISEAAFEEAARAQDASSSRDIHEDTVRLLSALSSVAKSPTDGEERFLETIGHANGGADQGSPVFSLQTIDAVSRWLDSASSEGLDDSGLLKIKRRLITAFASEGGLLAPLAEGEGPSPGADATAEAESWSQIRDRLFSWTSATSKAELFLLGGVGCAEDVYGRFFGDDDEEGDDWPPELAEDDTYMQALGFLKQGTFVGGLLVVPTPDRFSLPAIKLLRESLASAKPPTDPIKPSSADELVADLQSKVRLFPASSICPDTGADRFTCSLERLWSTWPT